MSNAQPEACSRCGGAIDPETKCEVCGRLLCHYEIRVLGEYETLCQQCYEDLTFQYRAKSCDFGGRDPG
ncbi:MAG TPA: hypothetical protein VK436_05165 [Methanocella sp.]|nr:hypothetical protein [Methanocella sp.]